MKFEVTLQRDTTEQATVTVYAASKLDAWDIAKQSKDIHWKPTDFQGHPEVTCCNQINYDLENEHPEYCIGDWQYEVQSSTTCLGYHDWCIHREEDDNVN